MTVIVVGSSNMDLNIYSKRFPNPGETVTGGIFEQFLGGKGANQSVASARSGATTIFIGKIGVDPFGDQMISQLKKEGILVDHVIRDPHEISGVAFILIDENGENMISVAPGANHKLKPGDLHSCRDVIKNSNVVVVQMEIPMETIQEVFNIASEGDVIKILNPAPLKPIPLNILEKINILIPNEGELFRLYSNLGFKDLTGKKKEQIIIASKEIANLGIDYIITTLGSKGCLIYDSKKENINEVPAPRVKTIDTVGAGDCFTGVLASSLSKGKSIENSVSYATVAASIAVTRKGAQSSMPLLSEIEERIKELNI